MAKKPTKQETIDALTTALAAMIRQDAPDGVTAAYAHAKELLQELGAMPVETVHVPMTTNRVIAVYCEMYKAYFNHVSPRLDGENIGAAGRIAKMFSGCEETHLRTIIREYFEDHKDPWMNGGIPGYMPKMHLLRWLDDSARLMRYEQQIADREREENQE